MKYPKEFIEKCKAIYPEFTKLHEALEVGSENLRSYLDDEELDYITIDIVLDAENLESLKQIALDKQMQRALYIEWYYICHPQK